jgi:ferredoxin
MDEELRVTIDRDECISCGVCWTTCPEVFEENEDDGLSQIVEEYRVDDREDEGQAPEDLEDCLQDAAADCPVEIIHVGEGD